MSEKKVFIAPASKDRINESVVPAGLGEETGKLTSLQGIIPIENIADTLSEEEKRKLEEIYPDRKIRMWGTVPANKGRWQPLAEGDYVLFYAHNNFICWAETAYKTINKKLAEKVWGQSKSGGTWEYVFFVKNVKELNVTRKDFGRIPGYSENFVPQGFMQVINEKAREYIIKVIVSPKMAETEGQSTFRFVDKDFLSCTGKKKDAQYLNSRFKELLTAIKGSREFKVRWNDFKGYVARAFNRGSQEYRDYMWLGFGHSKYSRAQDGVQFQVSINKEDPISIEIFADQVGRVARKEAKTNIEKNRETFLKLVNGLSGFLIGYFNHDKELEKECPKMSEEDLTQFLENMDQGGIYVYISREFSQNETIRKGDEIVPEIIRTWSQLQPLYNLMVLGKISGEVKEPVTELRLQPKILSQVRAALNAGQHIILTGPVGTGKTTLAVNLCAEAQNTGLCAGHVLTTASSDWTTFDTIGGYMPSKKGQLEFREGKFLEAIASNKWLIIDEINRADIDKAFGQLFTVLSGQKVELPFRLANGKTISIDPTAGEDNCDFDGGNASYRVGNQWRIIATMNVYDMNFLFEMSYAFMRRFAFIYVDLPDDNDYRALIGQWCGNELSDQLKGKLIKLTRLPQEEPARKMGPAIIRDVIRYIKSRGESEEALAEAVIAYILPQLEGLESKQITEKVWPYITTVFDDQDVVNSEVRPVFQDIVGVKIPEIQ